MLGSRGVSVKAFRPCVPRHRVTHFHPMPSRITRNSHRPRASDRTMVASEATSSLATLLNSTAASQQQRNSREWTTSQTSPERKFSGLDLEKRNLASGRGGTFFLTSLFIEHFERQSGILSANGILRQSSRRPKFHGDAVLLEYPEEFYSVSVYGRVVLL